MALSEKNRRKNYEGDEWGNAFTRKDTHFVKKRKASQGKQKYLKAEFLEGKLTLKKSISRVKRVQQGKRGRSRICLRAK